MAGLVVDAVQEAVELAAHGRYRSARYALERIGRRHDGPGEPGWGKALAAVRSLVDTMSALEQLDQRLLKTKHDMEHEMGRLRRQGEAVVVSLVDRLGESLVGLQAMGSEGLFDRVGEPDPSEGLIVRALGGFEVTLGDGSPVALCSNRKGRTLFKLLVSAPGAAWSKDELLHLLWPDEDPSISTGKLHVAVSRLRKSLREAGAVEDGVVLGDDGYRIRHSLVVQSDVALFDSRYQAGRRLMAMDEPDLAAEEFEMAVSIYRGPYLPELVREEWPIRERARLEEQLLRILGRLANWYLEKGRLVDCTQACRWILRLDSLREDAVRALMRALSRQGKRNQALVAYQNCAAVLRQDLAVDPMKETVELMERIRSEKPV